MMIEWNGNVEPKLREVNNINVDIESRRDCCGNVERNVLEKTVETIVSVFDSIKISVNSLLNYCSSLLFGVINIDLKG